MILLPENVTRIVVHCSATKADQDIGAHESRKPRTKGICLSCGKSTWIKSVTRCKTCSNKSRSLPDKFCINCGVLIHKQAKKRCLACHNKNQNKGATTERIKFNASKKWSNIRNKVFQRDNWTCKKCGKGGGIELNAHHIKSWASYPELRLDENNLMTLCVPCHKDIHANERLRKSNKICS